MTSQAGHLDDPGVGVQLATWYHSGGGSLARDWFCHRTGATSAQGCLGSAAVALCPEDRATMAHVYVGGTTMALCH